MNNNIDFLLTFQREIDPLKLAHFSIEDVKLLLTLVSSDANDETFATAFPDELLAAYTDKNGRPLRGLDNSKINRLGRKRGELVRISDQRAYLRQTVIPSCRHKLKEVLKSKRFQECAEDMSPEILAAFHTFATF